MMSHTYTLQKRERERIDRPARYTAAARIYILCARGGAEKRKGAKAIGVNQGDSEDLFFSIAPTPTPSRVYVDYLSRMLNQLCARVYIWCRARALWEKREREREREPFRRSC